MQVKHWVFTVLTSVILLLMPYPMSNAFTGPMERPAIKSHRASASTILAVTNSGKRLVAVGERGIILLSDDNGVTWRQAQVPVSVSLTAAHFPSPDNGWVTGHFGIVLNTTNGGETWVKQFDGKKAADIALNEARSRIKKAQATSRKDKALIAEAKLLVDDGPDKPFLDVYFKDDHNGFIIGAYNLIFHTTDAGNTWQPWLDRTDNHMGLHLYGMKPANEKLFIAGEQGLFLRLDQTNKAFKSLTTPYYGSYFGILTTKAGEILIFGLCGNLFRSNDNGEKWQKIETNQSASITAGTILSDDTIVLTTQAGTILTSHDRGKSFHHHKIEPSFPFSSLIEAGDGSLILTGTRGIIRVPNIISWIKGGSQ